MGSKQRKRPRRSARGPATKIPRRRLLVVCEGERTEREYVEGFKRWVKNPMVEVRIVPEGPNPKTIVECAKAEKRRAMSAARRGHDSFLDYDEVWCVFDRDEHDHFEAAIVQARDNGFECAVSNPCFELWLLLHHRESPGARHRDEVSALLKQRVPGQAKAVDFDDYIDGVGDASRRARALDADAAAMGEAGRNPTTGVYRLIDSIARKDDP